MKRRITKHTRTSPPRKRAKRQLQGLDSGHSAHLQQKGPSNANRLWTKRSVLRALQVEASLKQVGKIPATSQTPPFETQGRQLSRESTNFSTTTPSRGRPHPTGRFRTQQVSLRAHFLCLRDVSFCGIEVASDSFLALRCWASTSRTLEVKNDLNTKKNVKKSRYHKNHLGTN